MNINWKRSAALNFDTSHSLPLGRMEYTKLDSQEAQVLPGMY